MHILYEEGGVDKAIYFDATVREDHYATSAATERAVEQGVSLTDHVRPERRTLTVEAHVSNTPTRQVDPGTAETSTIETIQLERRARSLTRGATVKGIKSEERQTAESLAAPIFGVLPGGNALLRSVTREKIPTFVPAEYTEVVERHSAFVRVFDLTAYNGDRVVFVYDQLEELRVKATVLRLVTSLHTYENMVLVSIETPRDAQNSEATTFTLNFAEVFFGFSETTTDLPAPLEVRAIIPKNEGNKPPPPPEATPEPSKPRADQSLIAKGADALGLGSKP